MSPGARSEHHLRHAIAFLEQGDPASALRAASEACHHAPDRPEPHYAYGQAWLALDEPAHAEPAFATAIRLKPGWADAWINYGIAQYRQGRLEDAKSAMREALARVPGHPAALANLGAFLRISGEAQEGEALLQAAVAQAPDNIAARLNLAADLLLEERAEEALALLDAAMPAGGDRPARQHWHLQRALAFLQLGHADGARSAMAALAADGPLPAALQPLLHWRHVLLALIERDPARAREQAERMEVALGLMGPEAVPEHQIMARFDLAKFWSGQDRHALAFRQWREGHRLLGGMQPFSRDRHRAFVDTSIASFNPARFARPRAGNADPAPVFIVGMPRSGTTLCEQILAAHRDVHGAGERPALALAFGRLGGDAERVAAAERESLDPVARDYLENLKALAPDRRRIVDKMPGNFLHLGLIGLLLPGARIIHCVRDPRDVGLSIFTFRFHGQHGYAHDLGDLGWYIGEHDRLMAHWRRVLPNPILTVRLSDWVDDFAGTLDRMLAHLDLPPDPDCFRFHERESRVRTVSRAQVRQPVNARGLGRWRAYATDLAPMIAELDASGALEGWL